MSGAAGDRLHRFVADILGIDEATVDETSSPDTVGEWDSLAHVLLVSAMDEEFGAAISLDEAIRMRSVADVREVLRAHGVSI